MSARRAERVASAARPEDLPAPGLPEVAFLGRSNVGKSSLLNRLVGRKSLARTSTTPGKTRLVHFYRIEDRVGTLLFVDLPGYGWARVSKTERAQWQRLVEAYLENRSTLRLAVLLQDVRRDLSDDELLLLAWLAERQVPALLAVTKIDKLKRMRRTERLRRLEAALAETGVPLIATSAETNEGIDTLWREIASHVSAR